MDEITRSFQKAREEQKRRINSSFINRDDIYKADEEVDLFEGKGKSNKLMNEMNDEDQEDEDVKKSNLFDGIDRSSYRNAREYSNALKIDVIKASDATLLNCADMHELPYEMRILAKQELQSRKSSGISYREETENLFSKACESEDLEKGELLDMLTYNSGNLKIIKTGKQIQEAVKNYLIPRLDLSLTNVEGEIDGYLKDAGDAPTHTIQETNSYWLKGLKDSPDYKIYDWDETYVPSGDSVMGAMNNSTEKNVPTTQEESDARRNYNSCIRQICDILSDKKAADMLLELSPKEKYELTPRQFMCIGF